MAITIIVVLVLLLAGYLFFTSRHNIETKNKNNPMDNDSKTTRLDKP